MFTYTTRKDGRLMKKVSVNGKPVYLYSNDAKDLEKQYIELKYKGFNGINVDDSQITFKQWAEKWFDVNISTKEYNTSRNIRILLNAHIYPAIGYMKIKNIKVINIKELQKNLIEKGLTATTNRVIATIKRILNDAVENDIVQKNVAFNIKSVKYIKKEIKPLTLYEDELLLNVAPKHKYGLFFLVLRYTGIRTEEIIPLTIHDIDLKNKKILINKAVYFKKGKPFLKETKNRKTRQIPILNIIFEELKKHIDYCVKNNQELLFLTQKKKEMLTAPAIRWMLKSFLLAINKENEKNDKIYFTDHVLRHSYCTMLYYSGIKIKKAQDLMGHSSADMVYNVYTHLDEERENVEEILNNYCAEKLSKKLSK